MRFLEFLRPYWKKGLVAFLLMMAGVALQLPLPFLTRFILDRVVVIRNYHLLNQIGFALVAIVAISAFSSYLERRLLIEFRAKVIYDIRVTIFQHLQKLPLDFFYRKQTGYVMSRVSDDVEAVQGLLADTFVSGLQNLIVFIAGIACTLYIHRTLALLSFMLLPFYGISIWYFNRRIRESSYLAREGYGMLQKDLQEMLSGIFLIKAFCREDHSLKRVRLSTKTAVEKQANLDILSSVAAISSGLIAAAAPVVLIWYGCREIMNGALTVGGLVAFNTFLRYLFGPTQTLVNLNFGAQQSLAACQRLFEILDTEPEVVEREDAIALEDLQGEIVFDRVRFSYDSSAVLDGVSFRVRPGEAISIVGKSGVGKSTIVSLLLRLYEPEEGRVLIDGQDLRNIKTESLRKSIGLVSQDTFLFSDTIRENIRFGRPDASDEEVIDAAKLSHAHDFIESLPEGYDTVVGERGYTLSGGERQRIAIARAILRNPRIMILDEAMSQVDSESECVIQHALRPLIRGRTTIIIAHRISTLRLVDRILVLDGGKIVEEGSHEELYKKGGLYRRLVEHQLVEKG